MGPPSFEEVEGLVWAYLLPQQRRAKAREPVIRGFCPGLQLSVPKINGYYSTTKPAYLFRGLDGSPEPSASSLLDSPELESESLPELDPDTELDPESVSLPLEEPFPELESDSLVLDPPLEVLVEFDEVPESSWVGLRVITGPVGVSSLIKSAAFVPTFVI